MIRAALEGGSIVIAAGISRLADCRQIKGARYDAERRAWLFPATAANATRLLKALPELENGSPLITLAGGAVIPAPPVTADVEAEVIAPSLAMVTALPAVPENIKAAPWRHQLLALDFTLASFQRHLGAAMLAMRMGTGKSLVALMTIVTSGSKIILILCPRRVIAVWVGQILKHWSARTIVAALDDSHGTVAERVEYAKKQMKVAAALGVPFVAIINFDACFRPAFSQWSLKITWDIVVVDESHRTKAPGGKASLFLKALRSHALRRLMLTGTPMPHSPLDIYAQFRFLDPRIFGTSFAAFRQTYAVMGGFKDKQVVNFKNLDDLQQRMYSICFRVDESVLVDVPKAVEIEYECDLDEVAMTAYDEIETGLVTEIQSGIVTAANAMVRLLRLQQITGGALKADQSDRYDRIDTSKIELLADILDDLGPDEPWVCFCRFHADLDAVHEAAAIAALKFGRPDYVARELSGRIDQLEQWQNGDGMGLAVQTSAGGIGVDLTRAAYSIFYSLSFSLGEYDQALARTVRPGQTRTVTHIFLVVAGTIDKRIRRALARRAEVIEAVLAELQGMTEVA